MNLEPKLRELEAIYAELEKKMADPAVVSDIKEMQNLGRKHSELEEVVGDYRRYRQVRDEIAEAKELVGGGDHELAELAKMELEEKEPLLGKIEEQLRVALLPKDPNDEKDVIMEIRAGTGGDEASLFAADLFRMYSRYAEREGWKLEIVDENETEVGGYKEIVLQIHGRGVYSQLKYESGVHRVQRVPATEAGGRIHTSAATVVVMPVADDIDIEIRPEDLKIDTYRSSGAGGQHVNMTDSAVRITHLPTGIVVQCQNERSQVQNKEMCFRWLRARLAELKEQQRQEQMGEIKGEMKKIEWGSQIRSYVFMPYQLVKDNRTAYETSNINAVMDGDLDGFINAYLTCEATGNWATK